MRWLAGLWMALAVSTAGADDARAAGPAPVERDVVLRDFRFHTGEVLPEVKLHVTTLGEPSGIAVLILHGTAGSGATMLGAGFGGLLFGPGQVLDAARHYIIVPDALGTGQSTRPSDGLRAKFPRYNYDDMVLAQYRLLTPWAEIPGRFRAHPAGLARFAPKQPIQEIPCRRRDPLLAEQRTKLRLHIPQRRRPKPKRRLNRCSDHPCSPESWGPMDSEPKTKRNCNATD